MRIVNDPAGDYPDGPTVKINLIKHDDLEDKSNVLFYGYNSVFNEHLRSYFKNFTKKILLNLWMPTEFNGPAALTDGKTFWQPDGNYLKYFDIIYSICPYTIKWLKEICKDNRYKYIYHPFASPKDYNGPELNYEKIYDVCYFGGMHGPYHIEMAKIIKNYNSRISYIIPNEYTTDVGLTHHQKMQMVANSKISIVFNQCPLAEKHIQSIKSYSDWEKNEAFCGVNLDIPVMPQYKCRTAEAAYGKSIILVQKDRWNIIEHFFSKDEFIYFENINDLKEKIDFILKNYSIYTEMIEKAYKKSLLMDGTAAFNIIKNNL